MYSVPRMWVKSMVHRLIHLSDSMKPHKSSMSGVNMLMDVMQLDFVLENA